MFQVRDGTVSLPSFTGLSCSALSNTDASIGCKCFVNRFHADGFDALRRYERDIYISPIKYPLRNELYSIAPNKNLLPDTQQGVSKVGYQTGTRNVWMFRKICAWILIFARGLGHVRTPVHTRLSMAGYTCANNPTLRQHAHTRKGESWGKTMS